MHHLAHSTNLSMLAVSPLQPDLVNGICVSQPLLARNFSEKIMRVPVAWHRPSRVGVLSGRQPSLTRRASLEEQKLQTQPFQVDHDCSEPSQHPKELEEEDPSIQNNRNYS